MEVNGVTIKFDDKGLVPAVVQDFYTKEVLTVAYMNEESLGITMDEGYTCFWSRSRQELWRKGVEVSKDGPACHTGAESCFFNELWQAEDQNPFSYERLYDLIKGRKTDPKEGSYTTYLFDKGMDKILKKVGEESTEVIIAAAKEDKAETIYEVADLAYHVMTMMVEAGIELKDVTAELARRHVIDKKKKQEYMGGSEG